jgi:hypothetical protein
MRDISKLARHALVVSIGAGLAATMGAAVYAKDSGDSDTASQQFTVTKTDDGTVEYCTKMPAVTGSRIERKVCKTAQEWEKDGVHISVK